MKKIHKKIIVLVLIFSLLTIAKPSPARADFWGANMMSTIFLMTTEKMEKSIQDTLLSNLKIAGIRILQARLMALLSSSSSSSVPGVTDYIISDWKMFIYSSSMKYSDMMLTDFFQQMNAGATRAIKKNILDPAKRAADADSLNKPPDLHLFCPDGDASKAFLGTTRNSWICWRMAALPRNDMASMYLQAEGVKQAAYQQEMMAKFAEGIAGQGYKGKESSTSNRGPVTATTSSGGKVTVPPGSDYKGVQNKITTPGIMIRDLLSEVNNMPIRMMTMAQSIPEVATALANQVITQVIQEGATQIIDSSSGNRSSSNMGDQLRNQTQFLIQNGVREAASPNTFFGR